VLPARSLVLAALLAPACAPAAPPPPSFLLLTLDTTNPEALGCYGGSVPTPHLDRLAREGILFEDARAVAPLTLPAHASILTGLYPPRHSVRRNGETRLPEDARTLAERARAAGYETAAFVAAVVLAPEFGLTQGFEHYDAPSTPEDVEAHLAASRSADEVVARARTWLEARDADQPFFLWLHFYDPHFPYAPPAELAQEIADPYQAEVVAMDAAIGRVLGVLEARGALAHTLVVAVADHGESRGRHGEDTHGAFVYDSTLRIPFLVRLPDGARAGERVPAATSQVDVVPLACRVLGWPLEADLDGHDPLAGEPAPGAYFESYFGTKSFGWGPVAGWTDGAWKYVCSSAPELFDLRADPGESASLLAAHPAEADALRARMQALCGRPRLPVARLEGDQVTLQREIERLGYAGVGAGGDEEDPEPLDPGPAPSPHRMVAAYAAYMEGRRIYEEGGPRAQALAHLERAVQANPENHKAWFTLGLAAQETSELERAAAAFRRVLAMPGGERIPAQLNYAVCLYNLGRPAEALATLEEALAETPGPPGALEVLVRLLEEAGRTDDAARARARILARDAARARER